MNIPKATADTQSENWSCSDGGARTIFQVFHHVRGFYTAEGNALYRVENHLQASCGPYFASPDFGAVCNTWLVQWITQCPGHEWAKQPHTSISIQLSDMLTHWHSVLLIGWAKLPSELNWKISLAPKYCWIIHYESIWRMVSAAQWWRDGTNNVVKHRTVMNFFVHQGNGEPILD